MNSLPVQDNNEMLAKLTSSLCIPKSILRGRFGDKADIFLNKFSIQAWNKNLGFSDPFSVNEVSISPIIDIGEFLYIGNTYRLMESIYESPFYWMFSDAHYKDVAANNRGAFLEKIVADILARVFETKYIHRNVEITNTRNETIAEADILVAYGEFIIVVEAKSKRITYKARAGDNEALHADFEAAIQAPYMQALRFAKLILSGERVKDKRGKYIEFQTNKRVFPLVALSDGFPSITFLSSHMLERAENIAPAIWDIGVLDCVAHVLRTPIDMLAYLKARSDTFDRIISDSEFNILGYHVQQGLAIDRDTSWVMIDRDFAGVIDDFMISIDLRLNPEPPKLYTHNLGIPIVNDVLMALHSGPPEFASLTIDLHGLSEGSLERLGQEIQKMREEVRNGKALKALSLEVQSGGLTYVVSSRSDANARSAAKQIGNKHKYDNKAHRWFVVFDCVQTTQPIDAVYPILEPWVYDSSQEINSKRVEEMFGSRRVSLKPT